MWWEIRKLGVVVVAVDAVVVMAVLAGCVALDGLSRNGIGSALFLAGLAMMLLGAGTAQSPLRLALPFQPGRGRAGEPLFQEQALNLDPADAAYRAQQEIDRFAGMTWPNVLAVAGVPLLIASLLVILA